MLVAVLHFIHGPGAATPIVRHLLDALPGGSYLVVSNATKDFSPPSVAAVHDEMLAQGRTDAWPRDHAEMADIMQSLEVVEPGIVAVSEWRPERSSVASAALRRRGVRRRGPQTVTVGGRRRAPAMASR